MATLRNQRTGLGRKPALLIIDANVGFTDPTFPLGAECSVEIAVIAKLISAFRQHRLPVVYTRHAYRHASEAPAFRAKLPQSNLLIAGSAVTQIDPRIAPAPEDIVIDKTVPSAFFDSPLRQMLYGLGVDSAVVVGFSTSGCVRASAVDAMQCNFKLVVVREACGDRDPEAHQSNLRDLDLKYGDVVGYDEFMTLLERAMQGAHAPATADQAQKSAA